ncbi:hypothetical protein FHW64_004486 [Variovorax sp. Sphag1AA]|nr:hypothetical protein [Variovorax sp. Sphag1AA]
MNEFTPSLAHFVWLGHSLSGGNPNGPAKPVPRGSWAEAAMPVSTGLNFY